MKRYLHVLVQTAAVALLLFSCDRERSNPLDPQSDTMQGLPPTPAGLVAESGVGVIRLGWQPVEDRDLAGYALYRAVRSNGEYEYVPGDGDTTLGITTGKTTFIDSLDAAGTTFFYRVAAVDTLGLQSELSGFVGATVLEDKVPPEAPQNLSVVADETQIGRVVVRWTTPRRDADGRELTGLEGFVVFRAEVGTGGIVAVDTLAADVQEYVDEGLKALTTYIYTVMGFDQAGNESQLASPQQASTRGLAVPPGLRALGETGRIELNWQAVDADELLGYNVYRSTRSDTGYALLPSREGALFTTGQTTYVDSNLAGGQLFFYKVSALVAGGQSELSGFVSATAEADEVPPSMPQNLSAVPDEEDFGRVTLSWNAPVQDADGGDLTGLSGYVVFRSEETASSFVRVAQVGAEVREYVDTGLEESKTYFYTVIAVDGVGNESGRATHVQVKTQGPDRVAPESPSNVSAVPDEEEFGRVVVRWSPSVQDADGDELSGLSGYVVFRSEGTTSSFVPVDTVAAEAREYVDTGLRPLMTYFYTVMAFDEEGNESQRAATAQTQTQGVSVPSGLRASGETGRIELNWSASDAEDLRGYNVYRSIRSDTGYELLPSREGALFTTGQTTYVDSNLAGGQLFFYKVSAVTSQAESQRSGSVSATAEADEVPPAAPADLAAIADASAARITLSWSAPTADSNGGELTGLDTYIISRSKDNSTSFVAIDTVEAGETRFEDADLEASTLYFYAVRAVDPTGNTSARAAPVSAQTAGIAAPSGVTTEGSIKRIVVSWQASDAEDLRGYNVYRSTRSDGGYTRLTGVEGTSYTTGQTAYIDSGLTGGVTFFYQVSVVTAEGESERSAFDGGTVQSDSRSPDRPTFVDGDPVVDNPEYLSLHWKAPTADINGAELTGLSSYLVYRAESSDGPFDLVGTSTTATFVDTGLTAQTTYYYQIEASDEEGNVSPRSTTATLTTGGVEMPKSVTLSASTPSNEAESPVVTIRWVASAGAILYYEVQRTTVANSTNDEDYDGVPPNTLDTFREDDGVERGKTYYYRVRARDVENRFSDWTTPVSVEVKE